MYKTITNGVYGRLVKRKKDNENFSKLFSRLMEGDNSFDVLKRLGAAESSKEATKRGCWRRYWISASRGDTVILVDTDILIEILDKGSPAGERALSRIRDGMDSAAITSITLHEILYGRTKRSKDTGDVLDLPVMGYTKDDAGLSALLGVNAEKRGRKVSRMDSMIAAMAIDYGAMPYANNTKAFGILKDLNCFRTEHGR